MSDTRISNRAVTKTEDLVMSERMWKEQFDLSEKAVVKQVFAAKQVIGKPFGLMIELATNSDLDGAAKTAKLLKSKGPAIIKSIAKNDALRLSKRSDTFAKNRAATTIDLDGPVPKPKPKAKAKAKAKRARKPKTLVDVFATDDAEET